jgi:stress response protein YsnF
MSLEENTYSHLEELSGSDFEIVDGEPNIIGWDVKNEERTKIGDVSNLLFDPETRKVRYLVVDLDNDYLGTDDDRKVLVPIGVAELHGEDMNVDDDDVTAVDSDSSGYSSTARSATEVGEHGYDRNSDDELDDDDTANKRGIYRTDEDEDEDEDEDDAVIIPNVTAAQLSELPRYEKGKLTPQDELTIRRVFEGAGVAGAAAAQTNFYDHDHFNEERFYGGGSNAAKASVIEENLQVGKRDVETGGARITSRLVERPVEESINLREEHVNVERTPVNRPVTDADQAFQPMEIELTEHAEVPVISKEARVVEEVSLSKDVEEKEETIRDTVRNTEVDTERITGKESGSDGFTRGNTDTV